MSAAGAVSIGRREARLLVASSREEFRKKVLRGLEPAAIAACEAAGGADALLKLSEADFRTLVLDPQIEDLDVEELVETIRARHPEVDVVVPDREQPAEQLALALCGDISGRAAGGPANRESPIRSAAAALWAQLPEVNPAASAAPAPAMEALPRMIGTSRGMQRVYRLARLVAPRDTAVLVVGATGTGKELVARGIHELSPRGKGPFVVVNCAAIPESLLEAELFGFTRGAFTGAFQSRLGRIHAAQGGTLLLDEVSELPLGMQAKLLRFVQDGEVQRLGSADVFRVDARVIAATNADLIGRVREKQFRDDLYYRLAVFPIELPPLCERPGDILPLAQHFLNRLCQKADCAPKAIGPEAAELLRRNAWPGNVRELQHQLERAFVLAEDRHCIGAEDLSSLSNTAGA